MCVHDDSAVGGPALRLSLPGFQYYSLGSHNKVRTYKTDRTGRDCFAHEKCCAHDRGNISYCFLCFCVLAFEIMADEVKSGYVHKCGRLRTSFCTETAKLIQFSLQASL